MEDLAPRITDWFLSASERGGALAREPMAPQAAWSDGNCVVALHHGREYFRRLNGLLDETEAGDLVVFTDWRGDPDERLDGPGTEFAAVLASLAHRGVRVRGLVWRSHPDEFRFSEQENHRLARIVNAAGGQIVRDERVRRAGSHHQKLFLIHHPGRPANDVAFVGGIDVCHGRNDDAEHRGDPQVIAINSRYGPTPAWHDVQLEISGPVIDDLYETFRERWNDPQPPDRWRTLRTLTRRRAPEVRRTPLPPLEHTPTTADGHGSHSVQVLRTYPCRRPAYPFAPRGERSIALAYTKAFKNARRLIYIEDQYFWSMDAARRLGQAMRESPDLHVVVVLPRYPDDDGRLAGPANRIGQLRAIRHVQRVGGDRFAAYDLAGADAPIYVHAKICIVDDIWMTVGSDNLNRRSWSHDSELSCAVYDHTPDRESPDDGARLLARETRLSLLREHLQRDDVPSDPLAAFNAMREAASRLDAWFAKGRVGPRPPGRLRLHEPEAVPTAARPFVHAAYRLINDPDGRPWRLRWRGQY